MSSAPTCVPLLVLMLLVALGYRAIGGVTTAAAASVEDDVVDALLGRYESVVAEIQELVAIPSISALPDHAEDVRKAAEWVKSRLDEVKGKSAMDSADAIERLGYAHTRSPLCFR